MNKFCISLIGFGLAIVPQVSLANDNPSFDCARATTDVEKLICELPILSIRDKQMAASYTSARARFSRDRAALAELTTQQRTFLAVRDFPRDPVTGGGGVEGIGRIYDEHIKTLTRIKPRQTNWVGEWTGFNSRVTVISGRGGQLRVSLSANEPTQARWVCDYEMVPARLRNGQLVATYRNGDGAPIEVVLARRGTMLEVMRGPGAQELCGMNGTVAGLYFPVEARAR